ncbi:MAG: tRNA 2-thiocytidine biosynthesis TtcA family protein [Myxococcota bacterium]
MREKKTRPSQLPQEEIDDHRHKAERMKRNLDDHTFALAKRMGKAIHDYNMIREGDRVLVAVSGGKDSISLLHLLAMRMIWLPIKYELVAMHVLSDMRCAGCAHPETMTKFFEDLGVEYHFEDLPIRAHLKSRDLQMSCYHCAKGRRKVLFDACIKHRCNVLAMGHHLDDIAHTIMMNLFIHGRVEDGMNPCMDLFKGSLRLVRPLAYIHEFETADYVKRIGFSAHLCRCPHAKTNVRVNMREAVELLRKSCKWPEVNVFRAIYGDEGPGKPVQDTPQSGELFTNVKKTRA